ncbi:MAG: hypothetical protein IMZ61_14460 [Planctomycetes bacterium]|nr:hypothetical protein [Planctomycetota bacterium]
MDHDTVAWKKRTTTILLSVSFFVLTLFVFNPARIYIGNFMDFSYFFHESMLFFLIVSLILISMVFTAVVVLSRHQKTCRIIVSMLSVFAFLMWFQGNIFLWQYGVLNGKDIEWKTLIQYGIIDSVFWIALIAFSLFKADFVFRISRFMSLVFIIVQLLSVSQIWISMPKNQSFQRQNNTTNTLFLFSEHINVIILVLDTFQSDIFQDIILEDVDLKASFDGFTYFRNSLAGSDGTSVSIPNILTANNYDNTIPYLDFVKNSFLDNSLPKTLKEYSFSIDLYPIIEYSVYNDFSGIPFSGKKLTDWDAFFIEQAFLADLALFRSFPHFIKKLIYNQQRWFLSGFVERCQDAENANTTLKDGEQKSSETYNLKYSREFENTKKLIKKNWDAAFINTMIPSSGIIKNTDAFKFYHLNGIHPALIMNEDLEYEVMNPTRAGMKRNGTGILKIAAIFLERLKQMKVYDNSLIFIVGDHGSGLSDASINVSPYGARFNRTGPYKGYFKNFKTAGIPLILVKRINTMGELRISDAPVSLSDIPQTVVEELGLDASFPGKTMFGVKENEERERIYRAFLGPQEDVEYLAPLYEYSVNGFSWDDASWQETGNIYYAKPK